MLILLIVLIVISIMLFAKKIKNRSAYWMSFILCGWFLSMSGLVLFIAKYSGFYYKVNFVLFLNDSVRRFFLDFPISIDWVSRMITMGRSIFIFSLIGFALSLDYRKQLKDIRLFIALNAIFPVLNIIVYDPYVYKNLLGFIQYSQFFILSVLTRIWLVISIVSAFIIMFLQYRKISVPWVKLKMKSFFLGLISLTAFYFYLGFMGPLQVTDVRTLYFLYSDFTNFNPPLSLLEWYISIGITTATTLISVFALWKYSDVERQLGKADLQLERKFKTANMGVRVFTHALKNQILIIQVLLNQVKEQISDSGNPDSRQKTEQNLNNISEIINNMVERMNQLYNSFKSSHLQLKPVSIGKVVESALQKVQISPEHINIEVEIKNDVSILADVYHLSEAVYNIVVNAVEAIPAERQGVISVRVSVEVNWCIIQVEDNGSGIPPNQLETIFDPFYTSKNTNKNWGVGLSYCKQTVAGHYGRIDVKSEAGTGSIFRIFIPVYAMDR